MTHSDTPFEALEPQSGPQPSPPERSESAVMASYQETLSAKSIADDLALVMDIPVKMTIELGRKRLTIEELIRLHPGSVVHLDNWVGEPLNILINGYRIAQGEVVVIADKYGVRITDILSPTERMQHFHR